MQHLDSLAVTLGHTPSLAWQLMQEMKAKLLRKARSSVLQAKQVLVLPLMCCMSAVRPTVQVQTTDTAYGH